MLRWYQEWQARFDRAESARSLIEGKASKAGALIALTQAGRPVWTARSYAPLARAGYMRNAIVHRAVRMVAEAAGSLPFLLYDGTAELDDHPILRLLQKPNPRQSGADFVEALTGYLLLAGNAYIEAVAVEGEIRELFALRPDRMSVVPDSSGWPAAYEYAANGRIVRFAQDGEGIAPILHIAQFHPLDDHYGFAPLEAAQTSLDLHNQASAWNKALLDNAARPSGALVYKNENGSNLSEEQFERLRDELAANFSGAGNAGRPLLLEGGLSWQSMSLSPKDMDFLELSTARRARSRSPSGSRRCCSASPATILIRTTARRTSPSGGRRCCRSPGAWQARLAAGLGRPGARACGSASIPTRWRRSASSGKRCGEG